MKGYVERIQYKINYLFDKSKNNQLKQINYNNEHMKE